MGIEISFEQLMMAVGGAFVAMTGAITFLGKWILDMFNKLETKLSVCEGKHDEHQKMLLEVTKDNAGLRARLDEMDKASPSSIAATVAAAVAKALRSDNV